MPLLISVIIPFYNRSQVLQTTLEALAEQTYEPLEFILVDDGSTDGSFELASESIKGDARFKLLALSDNRGVSAARNLGLEAARGAYIAFVDSDDYTGPAYIKELFGHMQENKADLQICPIGQASGESAPVPRPTEGLFKLDSESFVSFMEGGNFYSVCGKLFMAELIKEKSLRFKPGLDFGEDLLFCLDYYRLCEKFAFNYSPLYVYNRGADGKSLSQKLRLDSYKHEKFLGQTIENFAREQGLFSPDLGKILKARLFDTAYNAVCQTALWPEGSLRQKQRHIKIILDDRKSWQHPETELGYSPPLVGAIFRGQTLFLTLYVNVFLKIRKFFGGRSRYEKP